MQALRDFMRKDSRYSKFADAKCYEYVCLHPDDKNEFMAYMHPNHLHSITFRIGDSHHDCRKFRE